MGLLRLSSQLRLRVVHTEKRECARNDRHMPTHLIRLPYINIKDVPLRLRGVDEVALHLTPGDNTALLVNSVI